MGPDIVSGNLVTTRPEGCPDKLQTILGKAIYDVFYEFI